MNKEKKNAYCESTEQASEDKKHCEEFQISGDHGKNPNRGASSKYKGDFESHVSEITSVKLQKT